MSMNNTRIGALPLTVHFWIMGMDVYERTTQSSGSLLLWRKSTFCGPILGQKKRSHKLLTKYSKNRISETNRRDTESPVV